MARNMSDAEEAEIIAAAAALPGGWEVSHEGATDADGIHLLSVQRREDPLGAPLFLAARQGEVVCFLARWMDGSAFAITGLHDFATVAELIRGDVRKFAVIASEQDRAKIAREQAADAAWNSFQTMPGGKPPTIH